MKRQNFLAKLRKEGKLDLVEPSNEICSSYLEKADNCLKSARILLKDNLYENSISESYYAMYDSLLGLFFKTGIKSENHTASILLLKRILSENELFNYISFAKNERIDKQYYVTSKDTLTSSSATKIFEKAEEFIIHVRLIIDKLNIADIKRIRDKFKEIIEEN